MQRQEYDFDSPSPLQPVKSSLSQPKPGPLDDLALFHMDSFLPVEGERVQTAISIAPYESGGQRYGGGAQRGNRKEDGSPGGGAQGKDRRSGTWSGTLRDDDDLNATTSSAVVPNISFVSDAGATAGGKVVGFVGHGNAHYNSAMFRGGGETEQQRAWLYSRTVQFVPLNNKCMDVVSKVSGGPTAATGGSGGDSASKKNSESNLMGRILNKAYESRTVMADHVFSMMEGSGGRAGSTSSYTSCMLPIVTGTANGHHGSIAVYRSECSSESQGLFGPLGRTNVKYAAAMLIEYLLQLLAKRRNATGDETDKTSKLSCTLSFVAVDRNTAIDLLATSPQSHHPVYALVHPTFPGGPVFKELCEVKFGTAASRKPAEILREGLRSFEQMQSLRLIRSSSSCSLAAIVTVYFGEKSCSRLTLTELGSASELQKLSQNHRFTCRPVEEKMPSSTSFLDRFTAQRDEVMRTKKKDVRKGYEAVDNSDHMSHRNRSRTNDQFSFLGKEEQEEESMPPRDLLSQVVFGFMRSNRTMIMLCLPSSGCRADVHALTELLELGTAVVYPLSHHQVPCLPSSDGYHDPSSNDTDDDYGTDAHPKGRRSSVSMEILWEIERLRDSVHFRTKDFADVRSRSEQLAQDFSESMTEVRRLQNILRNSLPSLTDRIDVVLGMPLSIQNSRIELLRMIQLELESREKWLNDFTQKILRLPVKEGNDLSSPHRGNYQGDSGVVVGTKELPSSEERIYFLERALELQKEELSRVRALFSRDVRILQLELQEAQQQQHKQPRSGSTAAAAVRGGGSGTGESSDRHPANSSRGDTGAMKSSSGGGNLSSSPGVSLGKQKGGKNADIENDDDEAAESRVASAIFGEAFQDFLRDAERILQEEDLRERMLGTNRPGTETSFDLAEGSKKMDTAIRTLTSTLRARSNGALGGLQAAQRAATRITNTAASHQEKSSSSASFILPDKETVVGESTTTTADVNDAAWTLQLAVFDKLRRELNIPISPIDVFGHTGNEHNLNKTTTAASHLGGHDDQTTGSSVNFGAANYWKELLSQSAALSHENRQLRNCAETLYLLVGRMRQSLSELGKEVGGFLERQEAAYYATESLAIQQAREIDPRIPWLLQQEGGASNTGNNASLRGADSVHSSSFLASDDPHGAGAREFSFTMGHGTPTRRRHGTPQKTSHVSPDRIYSILFPRTTAGAAVGDSTLENTGTHSGRYQSSASPPSSNFRAAGRTVNAAANTTEMKKIQGAAMRLFHLVDASDSIAEVLSTTARGHIAFLSEQFRDLFESNAFGEGGCTQQSSGSSLAVLVDPENYKEKESAFHNNEQDVASGVGSFRETSVGILDEKGKETTMMGGGATGGGSAVSIGGASSVSFTGMKKTSFEDLPRVISMGTTAPNVSSSSRISTSPFSRRIFSPSSDAALLSQGSGAALDSTNPSSSHRMHLHHNRHGNNTSSNGSSPVGKGLGPRRSNYSSSPFSMSLAMGSDSTPPPPPPAAATTTTTPSVTGSSSALRKQQQQYGTSTTAATTWMNSPSPSTQGISMDSHTGTNSAGNRKGGGKSEPLNDLAQVHMSLHDIVSRSYEDGKKKSLFLRSKERSTASKSPSRTSLKKGYFSSMNNQAN